MRFRELEKKLLNDGWYPTKQKGSHKHYKHPTKKAKVTIPNHSGDLSEDLVKLILKQAGLS